MASSPFSGSMRPHYMRNNLPTEDILAHQMSGMSLSNNIFGLQHGLQEVPNELNPDAIEFRSGRANHFTRELMKDMGARSGGGGKKSRRHRQYKERSLRDLSPPNYQSPMPPGQSFVTPDIDKMEGPSNIPGGYIRGRPPQPQGYQPHGPNPMQGQHPMPYYGNPFQGGNMHPATIPSHAQYQSQGWNQGTGPMPIRGHPFPTIMDGSFQRQQH